MTGFKFIQLAARFVAATAFALAATSAVARSIDIPLGVSQEFIPVAIDTVGKNLYCVSGDVVNESGPSKSAVVILVDVAAQRVVWKAAIPFPQRYVGNVAVRCASDGDSYFVLTEERTHSEESLNQTRVVVNKFSADGNLQKQQAINAGYDEWSYLLSVDAAKLSVAGGTSDGPNRMGKLSTFVAQFDRNLENPGIIRIENGAFWSDVASNIARSQLSVAGQFLPDSVRPTSGREGYAISRIDLDRKKYIWSTYVSPPDARAEKSVFASNGYSYYVALTPQKMLVSIIDAVGRQLDQFSVNKPICDLSGLDVNGNALRLVGPACNNEKVSEILSISLKDRSVTTRRTINGSVLIAGLGTDAWVGVLDTGEHVQVFRQDTP